MGRGEGVLGDVTFVRKCDSPQRDVKLLKEVCWLVEWCDGHLGKVRFVERCDSCQDMRLSSCKCESYLKAVSGWTGLMVMWRCKSELGGVTVASIPFLLQAFTRKLIN